MGVGVWQGGGLVGLCCYIVMLFSIDVFVSMCIVCVHRGPLWKLVMLFKCYPLGLLYLDTPWSCLYF